MCFGQPSVHLVVEGTHSAVCPAMAGANFSRWAKVDHDASVPPLHSFLLTQSFQEDAGGNINIPFPAILPQFEYPLMILAGKDFHCGA